MAVRIQDEIAQKIRAELVCCDALDRGEEFAGHAICYWGEAAARLAEEHRRDDEWVGSVGD